MAGGPFDMDPTGLPLPSSLPTSPPPAPPAFSRPGTGPRPTPAPQPGSAGASGAATPSVPTNDEIEAKIQAAMSSAAGARSPTHPPRDTRTQLFVGNLPYRVRWQDLKDLFRRSGTVLRADVSLGPDNRSRGYGTVLLATAEDAGRAIDMFNGYVWQTRTLEVRPDKMGLGGGVGMGSGSGTANGTGVGAGMNLGIGGGVGLGVGMGVGVDGVAGYGLGGFSAGLLGSGVGGAGTPLGASAAVTAAAVSARLGGTSPFLDEPAASGAGAGGSLTPSLAAQLARVASPGSAAGSAHGHGHAHSHSLSHGNGGAGTGTGALLHSPLLASPGPVAASVGGISLNSPRGLQSQLAGVGAGAGPLPFHVQWQDLKDLFRQAGTILRADVALGPEGRSRGFGTVSFATEGDAERAVKMFNGYDYNGRQLKVHYDKFSASATSAVPLAGPGAGFASLSAPQSPHPQLYATPHPVLSHAASLAQQVLVQQQQQQQREEQLRQEQHAHPRFDLLGAPASLQRAHTDQYPYQYFASDVQPGVSTDGAPGGLPRTHSDSVAQQLLHNQQNHLGAPSPLRADATEGMSPTQGSMQDQQGAPLHISLPPYRPPYIYDFSPGSPYGYDFYGAAMKGMMANGGDLGASALGREVAYGVAPQWQGAGGMQQAGQDQEPAPASGTVSPPTQDVPEQKPTAARTQTGSNAGSGRSSAQNSQPATQATSPTVASPTSAHSLHAHPAHPGPIALPPPVTAFPLPPPLSPAYHAHAHAQMSPYASPLHHPSMMVAMTPFGLPPITPSMPSFQFVPQPSPGPAPASGSADLLSPTVPTPGAGPAPNGAMDPQAQAGYPAHLRHPHGPMLSPYTPFSPGVAISPGAFWGRPGSGAVNPYINPAVGAPVHVQGQVQMQMQTGYFPPVPPRMEEPQGYFPPFPAAASRPSGLANEITQDSASASGSAEAEVGEAEGGGASGHGAVGDEGAGKRPDSAVSEGTTTGTGTLTGTETSPRPPSSTGTSWRTDSAERSPLKSGEVEKQMQALAVAEEGPRVPIRACESKVFAVARASSDSAQLTVSSQTNEVKTDGAEAVSRPEVATTNGRSLSDPAAPH
ncbi:hypothetical protein EIP86_002645 [Pleurotus ostreatoroseus]|nr:hypothetical protein EIP86_002645 [Pleurotus ostreatoroseus]